MTKEEKMKILAAACNLAGGVDELGKVVKSDKRTVYGWLAGEHEANNQVMEIINLIYGDLSE